MERQGPHLPDTRESVEDSPLSISIDMLLDDYNAHKIERAQALGLWRLMLLERIPEQRPSEA